jgi:serine/threonine-protein kinase RsbW
VSRSQISTNSRARPALFHGAPTITGVGLDLAAPGSAQPSGGPEPSVLARHSFAGRPDQLSAARSWMTALIGGFAQASDVVLACSELAANAIMHSKSGLPGGVFTVRACIASDLIRIEIIDQGGQWTGRPRHHCNGADDASQYGRGLTIVAAIASSWGIAGDHEGRTAWCEIKAE